MISLAMHSVGELAGDDGGSLFEGSDGAARGDDSVQTIAVDSSYYRALNWKLEFGQNSLLQIKDEFADGKGLVVTVMFAMGEDQICALKDSGNGFFLNKKWICALMLVNDERYNYYYLLLLTL
ncbi:uncharacterized protein A4U43_C04F1210 [Asparagus officinalis]|uniref:Translation initiation factor 5A C-terminal domain-containing protein n=1 Tax=Asparagus officinalis TaxID=4686 RepID=A0A5P1F026_ASPOF|nr:uncharacterized protein A4U43_C04F1210 [Asparagus officinalis]